MARQFRLTAAALFAAMALSAAPFLSPRAVADDASNQTNAPAQEKGTLTILFENDVFYRTDRDYTNGVQIAWTSPRLASDDWAAKLAAALPVFDTDNEVRKSYAIGQDIFTPSDIALKNPPLDDHPYAGYLYGAVGLLGKRSVGDAPGSEFDELQLQLGVVGPWSLAEETQKFVHSILNDTKPEGWHTQLHNEPALVLQYEHVWRYRLELPLHLEMQADPHLGAAVGNVYDFANAGLMARVGFNLPDDFGPPRVDPSMPGSYFFEPRPDGKLGAYLFAGVDGRAIARNIFLDGNTWQDSRHVDKENFVGDLDYGAAVVWDRFRLTYTHTFRTREFTTQRGDDQFGAISLSFRY